MQRYATFLRKEIKERPIMVGSSSEEDRAAMWMLELAGKFAMCDFVTTLIKKKVFCFFHFALVHSLLIALEQEGVLAFNETQEQMSDTSQLPMIFSNKDMKAFLEKLKKRLTTTNLEKLQEQCRINLEKLQGQCETKKDKKDLDKIDFPCIRAWTEQMVLESLAIQLFNIDFSEIA